MSIVEVQELRKQYDPPKGVLAVDGVSFDIAEGEIFSLLGPNGAGKSTTISMLSCLLRPAAATPSSAGTPSSATPRRSRRPSASCPQDIALYPDMSARENLRVLGQDVRPFRRLRSSSGSTRCSSSSRLVDRQKDRVDKFSGGMKRRVNIGVALLHKPKVLYLDEPTVGIDPQSRRSILDGILGAARPGDDDPLHHALHGRGAGAQRPHRHRRPRQDDRHRYPRGAREDRRRGRPRHCPRGPLPRGHGRALARGARAWTRSTSRKTKPCCSRTTRTRCCRGCSRRLPRRAPASPRSTSREPNLEMVFLHLTGRALRE